MIALIDKLNNEYNALYSIEVHQYNNNNTNEDNPSLK